jgi:elongator complex protein 3
MVKGGVPQQLDLSREPVRETVLRILEEIRALPAKRRDIMPILRRHPHAKGTYAKSQLLAAYRQLVEEGALEKSRQIEVRLRGRPVRTISGVAPVAVLTKPHPCPGSCIFCPEQRQAPKSYLDGEPGVLRALQHDYDPFEQTQARIQALNAIGHTTDKIELLILGGTWSSYPPAYREHFLKRCFDAMNETPSETLDDAMLRNERAPHRNVGLVVETRPDCVTPQEVVTLRKHGVTKVQVGAQSFDDRILRMNQRGHTLADIRDAVRRLRLAGFKIVLHWMPNLHGATLASDYADYARLWDDPTLRPDELKIYPTALLEGTDLYHLWQAGEYSPYPEADLIEMLKRCKVLTQPYCRINRLMRDIPAQYIVAGTTKSNLRQIIQQRMAREGLACRCVRCREVRGRASVDAETVRLEVVSYETDVTIEHFLQYLTPSGYLAGFLRLSLPRDPRDEIPLPAIREAAMVRELHVYGPTQALGEQGRGGQHRGLGTQMLEIAGEIACQVGYQELAVIAAVGTRPYYRARGFGGGDAALYLIRRL